MPRVFAPVVFIALDVAIHPIVPFFLWKFMADTTFIVEDFRVFAEQEVKNFSQHTYLERKSKSSNYYNYILGFAQISIISRPFSSPG